MIFPLFHKKVLGSTEDSMSFQNLDLHEIEIPVGSHVGAFGTSRKHHFHEGIDLYCENKDPVRTMEEGWVVNIEWFTGEKAGSPWWENTQSVLIAGESGVILYGELEVLPWIRKGMFLSKNICIGHVIRVLKKNKGRPMHMLHMELHKHGTSESSEWIEERPPSLLDPTVLFQEWI